MNSTTERIDALSKKIMHAIQKAAADHSLDDLARLTHLAKEAKSMKEHFGLLERRLAELEGSITSGGIKHAQPNSTLSNGMLRELRVEVTQGMINQNLLTLTDHVKVGRVSAGEDFTIEAAGSNDRFRSTLLANGNKLQERGAIGRFYRANHVKDGDIVLLKELSPNRWALQPTTEKVADRFAFR